MDIRSSLAAFVHVGWVEEATLNQISETSQSAWWQSFAANLEICLCKETPLAIRRLEGLEGILQAVWPSIVAKVFNPFESTETD